MRGRITSRKIVPLEHNDWGEFTRALRDWKVDALICGGIDRASKETIRSSHLAIIDNVTGTMDEILRALEQGNLQPCYGFQPRIGGMAAPSLAEGKREDGLTQGRPMNAPVEVAASGEDPLERTDCIACRDRVCERGAKCTLGRLADGVELEENDRYLLDQALDITFEEERQLCRLTELVYYCLEIRARRIGLAFCVDLLEPASILVQVLRRFFLVFPVCCKVGGIAAADVSRGTDQPGLHRESSPTVDAAAQIACNPLGQAEILNALYTDLNVIVGLCVGVDCIFTKASRAPVTTLFVKDRQLANNPIGAVYSEYYLEEASKAGLGPSELTSPTRMHTPRER